MKGERVAYPVVFTRALDGRILINVPDMEIFTEGLDYADAVRMARDAIGMKGLVLEDEGKAVPEASDPAKIDPAESKFADEGKSIVALVDIDFTEFRRKNDRKAVRKNVTIPAWLDFEARSANLNLSRVLQEAIKTRLGFE
ncbi:MAG: type II toxin-antitoxin system HicB family antitoxin [Lachnospiraceae bacterium]